MKMIQQAVADGKAFREKSTPPQEIEKIMRGRGFSPHNARRIRKEILGEPLLDDIPTGDTVLAADIKANTVRVTLLRDLGIDLYDIVRFRSKDYQVQRLVRENQKYVITLKEFARTEI